MKKYLFYCLMLIFIATSVEIFSFVFVKSLHLDETQNQRDWKQNYRNSGLYYSIDTDRLYQEQQQIYGQVTYDFFKFYKPLGLFHGHYMSTDANGFRSTVQFTKSDAASKKTVAFFGGSTLWGAGAAGDENTIPSLFGKHVNALDLSTNYVIQNYGVGGYNNSQVLVLFLETIEKSKPDYAIFFFFIAEAIAGYRDLLENHTNDYFLQPNVGIGYHAMVNFLKNQPSSQGKIIHLSLNIFESLKKLNTIKLLSQLKNRRRASASDPPLSKEEKNQVMRIMDLYEKHKRSIEALAREFQIKPIFVLEPSIYTKKTLSPYERKSPFLNRTKEIIFQEEVLKLAAEKFSKDSNVVDLRDSIQTADTIFLDDHHTEKKGNDIIASKLVELFLHHK